MKIIANRYEIVGQLSKSKMSAVYLAKDRHQSINSDHLVIIKHNIASQTRDEEQKKESIEAFKREMAILNQVRHQYLPAIIDYIDHDDGQYIVTNYIPGEDLQRLLDKGRAFSPHQVLKWIEQILEALIYLHNKEYFHRDIKPANIILSDDGSVVLIDFGVVTRTGTIFAFAHTAEYAAPEQLHGGSGKISASTDLYNLAATAYTLLTNEPPQPAENRIKELDQVRPLNITGLPKEVADVLYKALHIEQQQRWQNASDMLEALQRARYSLESPAMQNAEVVATLEEQTPLQPVLVPSIQAPRYATQKNEPHSNKVVNAPFHLQDAQYPLLWIWGNVGGVIILALASIVNTFLATQYSLLAFAAIGMLLGVGAIYISMGTRRMMSVGSQRIFGLVQAGASSLIIVIMTIAVVATSISYWLIATGHIILASAGFLWAISKSSTRG